MGRKTLRGEHLVTSATVISKDEIKQVLDQYLATVSPILCASTQDLGTYHIMCECLANGSSSAGGLNFGLSFHVYPYFVYARSQCSGESENSLLTYVISINLMC